MHYSHSCRDTWPRNACDPYFRFCLSRPRSRPSMSSCDYGRAGPSGRFNNQFSIALSRESSIGGIPNPWKVQVAEFYDSDIMLVTEVYDHDRVTRDDHMHTWGVVLREPVWHNQAQAEWAMRLSNPRGVTHSPSLSFKIRLYCDPNYYSSRCNVYCRAQDLPTGHYTCDESTGRKVCMPGWQGNNCQRDINECGSERSLCHSGTCHNSLGSYSCACSNGYSGTHCENVENPCQQDPCEHGTCFSRPDSREYTCVCEAGWEGELCQARTDPCQAQPCHNGGSCSSNDMKTSYTCSCLYPYTGSLCEELLTTTTSTTTTTPTPTAATTTSTTAPASITPDSANDDSTALETATLDTGKTSTAEQGILGRLETSRLEASDSARLDIWLTALLSGLAVMALVTVLLIFLLRRRRRKTEAPSRSSSVVYEPDGLTFNNETFPCPGGEQQRTRPGPRSPDGLRELPALPIIGSSDTDADLDLGAVGGQKTGCSNTEKKLPETFLRVQAGRAPPNDYADIRTLSRSLSSGPVGESHDDLDTRSTDTSRDQEEPHYAQLDDVRAQFSQVQALSTLVASPPEGNTHTPSSTEYSVPGAPRPIEPEYSTPRESPRYQTPRDVAVAESKDGVTPIMDPSTTTTSVISSGTASNPMYDSISRHSHSAPCDIEQVIPPSLLRH